ncbi:MAG TPA: lipopolysaccharide biosynthesis protein [Candidatus Limnocylindria bacterium]|nr:lipopolysaccharide biosynthesis protein [Candidatus Limnocylindria bacterium]
MREPWLPAEHGLDNRGLRQRVQRGLLWTLLDSWGRQLLGLSVFVVIARLVSETDIGLVALAAVFVAFAQIFVDQGLSDAIVQRKTLARGHIDTAFWISMGAGVLLAGAGVLLAIPIAQLVNEPELQPILQILSFSFVLTALSSVQVGLLRRELAFKSLALRSLLATAGGGVVGIALAFLGYGAWALVGQQLVQFSLAALTLWRVSPWRPGLNVSMAHFRDLFGYSRNVVGSDILGFLSRNTDNLLIGAFIGTAPLGVYAVGYRILDSTSSLLIGLSRRVAFPALSRLQNNPLRLKRAFFRVSRLSGALFIPGYIGLALVAQELVVVLFGSRWAAAGPVAAMLFLAGPVLGTQTVIFALLNATGHPGLVFRLRLIATAGNIIGFTLAVWIFLDILAVAAAYVLRAYLLMPLIIYWAQRRTGVPAHEYLAQFRGIVAAVLAMSGAVLLVKVAAGTTLGPGELLVVEAVAGGFAYLATLWIVERGLLRELLELARGIRPGRGEGGGPGRRRRRRRGGTDAAADTEEAGGQ